MANHFRMRVSDGINFKKGIKLTREQLLTLQQAGKITENETVGYWAIEANGSAVSRDFERNVKPGDPLWFIQKGGKVLGFAEFKSWSDDRTFSSDADMGWDGEEGGACRREVLYTNFIHIEDCDYSMPGPSEGNWARGAVSQVKNPQLSNGDNLTNIYKTLRQFKNARYD